MTERSKKCEGTIICMKSRREFIDIRPKEDIENLLGIHDDEYNEPFAWLPLFLRSKTGTVVKVSEIEVLQEYYPKEEE